MKKQISNMAASVHARLLKRAKAEGRQFNELLQYYTMERFLYRLSKSKYAERFVLKGALMDDRGVVNVDVYETLIEADPCAMR